MKPSSIIIQPSISVGIFEEDMVYTARRINDSTYKLEICNEIYLINYPLDEHSVHLSNDGNHKEAGKFILKYEMFPRGKEIIKMKEELENYLDEHEIEFALDKMEDLEDDFNMGDFRFIHKGAIDSIQVEELSSDVYVLGCFMPGFIADIVGLDYDAVKRAQESENFELLGELMLQHIDEVQQEYSSADGYGHHFSPYDGEEHEVGDYYVFEVD